MRSFPSSTLAKYGIVAPGSSHSIWYNSVARYFLAAMVALAIDMATMLLMYKGMHWSLRTSVSLGFVSGAITAYLLSIKWVFDQRRYKDAFAYEFLIFLLIGAAGLAATQLLIHICHVQWGIPLSATKLIAAVFTFAFNFLIRKFTLFQNAH